VKTRKLQMAGRARRTDENACRDEDKKPLAEWFPGRPGRRMENSKY
jgi:hypothetical protein